MKKLSLLFLSFFIVTQVWSENLLQKIDGFVHDFALRGRDTSYVNLPKQKFMVSLSYSEMFSKYKMFIPYKSEETVDISDIDPNLRFNDFCWYDINLKSNESKSAIGFYYYNISLKYSFPIQNRNTQQFTFNYNGSRFGVNLNYRYSKNLSGSVCNGYMALFQYIDPSVTSIAQAKDLATIDVPSDKSTLETYNIAFYYQFNGRKFNIASALSSKFIQRRSAGGFFIKGNYYYSSYFYRNDFNDITTVMVLGDEETYKVTQLSLGAGYGYNYTPNGGKLLFHFSAAPMFSVYNKAKHTTVWYEGNYKQEDYPYFDYMSQHPRLTVNTQARFAANYNFGNYVIGAVVNGNYVNYRTRNHFRLKSPIIDTSVYFGVRF